MKVLLATSVLLMVAEVFSDIDTTTAKTWATIFYTPRIGFNNMRRYFYPYKDHVSPRPETTTVHPKRYIFTPRLGLHNFNNKFNLNKHNNFHNHDYSFEISYDSTEWVCHNQRTGDMMVIAEDNDRNYPSYGKHGGPPLDQNQNYPTLKSTENPGRIQDESTEKHVFPDNDNVPERSKTGEGLIDVRSAGSDEERK